MLVLPVISRRNFGHLLAMSSSVGPIGTVAVFSRAEEPGEQRFCDNQRLKQPMGLPFSEWADLPTWPKWNPHRDLVQQARHFASIFQKQQPISQPTAAQAAVAISGICSPAKLQFLKACIATKQHTSSV
jgi:hypothetical protein